MTRKIFSVMLAVLLLLSVQAAAFAANPKISAQTGDLDYSYDIGERSAGYELWIKLDEAKFDDGVLTEEITMTDVRSSKIDVHETIVSGKKAIGSVAIKGDSNKLAHIVLTLADPFTGSESLEFDVKFVLSVDGKKQSAYEMEVTGILAISETEIFSDTVYVNLTGGQVGVAVENAKEVEFDLGNGVSVFARAAKGKRYSGSAALGPDERDLNIFDKYPDIEDAYSLSANVFGDSAKVKLDTSGDVYFVYDGDLEYLGKTSEMLPYSQKYYISPVELDVDTTEPLPDYEPEPELEEVGNNGSLIPDTGVSPILTIAIVAAVVALVVMLLLGRRKS